MFMITSLLLTIILPRQVSVIQKKGTISEDQMRDVKMPQVPGLPSSLPPAGQGLPVSPPAPETPKTEGQTLPIPSEPQTQKQPSTPHQTPLTQPLQKAPVQPKLEEKQASKPEAKEPIAPASPKGAGNTK